MYGNIVLLTFFLVTSIISGVEMDEQHCFSPLGYLMIDALLFAECFCFQLVMIFIQCGNPWKGRTCEKPSLKKFLLFRGAWSWGYFLMWFLAALSVGQAVHLLLFQDGGNGWLWMDVLGIAAACAGLAAGHAAGVRLWKGRLS